MGADAVRDGPTPLTSSGGKITQSDDRLRTSGADGGLRLAYQPLFPAHGTGPPAGVEALLRWPHPRLGPLSPGVVVPIAELAGHIVELGPWVLEEAVRQLVAWDEDLGPGAVGYVSVNISARQLAAGDLVQRVRDVVGRAGIAPHRLLLELTESALVEDTEVAAAQLQQLSTLGVRLALDDFGTGWASMASLQQLPFDVVKVDRSFVRHDEPRRRPQVLASMIALGRDLGLEVVTEGVETTAELEEVRRLGADLVQGWLLGRPVAPAEVAVAVTGARLTAAR